MTTTTKTLTGRVPREAIGMIELPRLPEDLLQRYRALGDMTGIIADALDQLGIAEAVIPGSTLRPTDPAARIVAQAITILNRRRADTPAEAVKAGAVRLGDIEGHNLAQPGDVLVIQGVDDISSMGSISAAIGKRQGEAGAIVDGAVRDIDRSRALGYPIWSRSISPLTGKWRLETTGVNVPVTIAGVVVHPGDLVIADEVGICIIPHARAADILAKAEAIGAWEEQRVQKIADGASVVDLAKR